MSSVVVACVSLVVWTAVLLLLETEGCMETAWSSGYLTSAVANFTFDPSRATSCRCCGLCHQVKSCASFSYNSDDRECRLYSSVASYESLTPVAGDEWQYFVMPGRSQHQQFCRLDSDCQVEGDFCRGRVCNDLPAVTCRVIFKTFGAGVRFGDFIPRMSGWLNNTAVPLACRMGSGFNGYTRLLMNRNGSRELTRQNILEYNTALDPATEATKLHSILSLEKYIRLSGNDTIYRIKVFRCDQRFMIDFEMPCAEPVLSDKARVGVGNATVSGNCSCVTWQLSPPYVPVNGTTLITINANNTSAVEGAIAREDGNISWKPCNVFKMLIYIRE